MGNDYEIRMQCLNLAVASAPTPGAPAPDFKSESVLAVAAAYYAFVTKGDAAHKQAA